MAIKAECPICHRKQAVSHKVCECGQDLDKAKRAKKVRYHITYRLNGKQRQEFVGLSIEGARTADAGRKTQKRENKLEDMLDIQAETRMSFKELTAWYSELEKIRCRAKGIKSVRRKQDCLKNFNAVFGERIVRDVDQRDLENYRLERLQEGTSKRTVDYYMGEARRMVKVAFDNNKVSARTWRTFANVKKLLGAGENVRRRVFELDEYLSLYPHLSARLRPLFDLALFTGMRPGEMVPVNSYSAEEGTEGLTWDRVDYRNRMLVLEAGDTKTGEARRIPITDEVMEILKGIPRDLRSNHVFTHRGKPTSDFREGLRRACKAAKITFGAKEKGGFVFRDLRTTADTLMVRAGVQDVYRRAVLGHKQKGMDRHYTHPDFEKDLRAAMTQYTGWLKAELEAQKKGQVAAC
ncbi:MAG TPA: site-specific integrase [Syntrophobacteria bacterium]|jgi:integrase|nr:site-specific integrase [Syntrophobacteria bacterium]